MNLTWAEEYFDVSFNRLRIFITYFAFLSILVRIILSSIYPIESAFSIGFLYRLLGVIIMLIPLNIIKNQSNNIRKPFMYAGIEIFNIALKITTLYEPDNFTILCILSTVFTVIFQSNIFESIYINFLISIKHLYLWYFINKKFSIACESITPVIACLFIITILYIFEYDKRKIIKDAYESKIEKENAFNQVSQILKIFNDALIIVTENLIVKYTNNSANKIISLSYNEYAEELENIKIDNSKEKLIEQLLKQNQKSECGPLGVTKINGKLYDWNVQIVDWDGEKCFMIKAQDITSIIELEKVKVENRSTNLLLRSISHEIKTPVNSIFLTLEEITKEIPEKLQEKFAYIKTCLELLKFQVSDIFDFSEIHFNRFSLSIESCDIKKTLVECAELFKHQVKHKKMDLICKIDPYIPKNSFIDKCRLQKVVVNLLSNSLKFTNYGSIELSASYNKESIAISVVDTGIGISKARINQLFTLFSNDSSSALCGLGLHISESILKYFGSSIIVESELGKGSKFSFELKNIFFNNPKFELSEEILTPSEEKYVLLPKSNFKITKKRSIKVLIVDDNEFNRICLGSILKSLMISYAEAVDGQEAVEKVVRYDKMKTPIKLIFMDCNMPIMDGWEATENINKKYSEGFLNSLPVIIGFTAYSSSEDIKRCFESGMVSYVLKPASKNAITSIISPYDLN